MAFEYKGKPLTKKEAEEFLQRTYLKPKKIFNLDPKTNKFVELKKKTKKLI